MNFKENLGMVVGFTLVSTIILTISLFFYVAMHDYSFVTIYETAEQLNQSGIFPDGQLELMENAIVESRVLLQVLDYMWVLSFILMISEMFYMSYFSTREDYFSILSLMTYGLMIILFITSIFHTISDWFYDMIVNGVLGGMSFLTPFFTFYLTNLGIINMLIVVVCIILNFVDFDVLKYMTRKDKEKTSDEIS